MARPLKIKVEIGALDRLSASLKRMEGRVKVFTAGVQKAGNLAGSVFEYAGAAAMGLGGALVWQGLSWAKSTDELSKFARQAGISIEYLQQLRFAAERQGVDVSQLSRGLLTLSRNLSQAKIHQGQLFSYLRKADPAFLRQIVRAKSTEEALSLLWKKMASIQDPAKRNAFAMIAFGRAGLTMARMVDGGTEALDALMEQAKRYGLVTGEQGKAAEEFQDRMTDLKTALAGVRNAIMGQIIPAITPLLARLAEWIAANRGIIATKVLEFLDRIRKGVGDLGVWWEKNGAVIKDTVRQIVDALIGFVSNLDKVKVAVEILAGVWIAGKLAGALQGAASLLSAFGVSLAGIGAPALAAAGAIGSVVAAIYTLIRAYEEWQSVKAAEEMAAQTQAAVERFAKEKGFSTAEAGAATVRARWEAIRKEAAGLGIETRGRTRSELERLIQERRVSAGIAEGQGSALGEFLRGGPQTVAVGGAVTIRFEGAPPGMRVTEVTGANASVPVKVEVGRTRAGEVAP